MVNGMAIRVDVNGAPLIMQYPTGPKKSLNGSATFSGVFRGFPLEYFVARKRRQGWGWKQALATHNLHFSLIFPCIIKNAFNVECGVGIGRSVGWFEIYFKHRS